jgi:hypothetical protein
VHHSQRGSLLHLLPHLGAAEALPCLTGPGCTRVCHTATSSVHRWMQDSFCCTCASAADLLHGTPVQDAVQRKVLAVGTSVVLRQAPQVRRLQTFSKALICRCLLPLHMRAPRLSTKCNAQRHSEARAYVDGETGSWVPHRKLHRWSGTWCTWLVSKVLVGGV